MLIMQENIKKTDVLYGVEMHMQLGHYRVEVWEVEAWGVSIERIFNEPCTDMEDATELFAIKVNEYK